MHDHIFLFGYDPQIVCHTDHNSILVLFFFDSYCQACIRALLSHKYMHVPADGGDHTGLIYRGNILGLNCSTPVCCRRIPLPSAEHVFSLAVKKICSCSPTVIFGFFYRDLTGFADTVDCDRDDCGSVFYSGKLCPHCPPWLRFFYLFSTWEYASII